MFGIIKKFQSDHKFRSLLSARKEMFVRGQAAADYLTLFSESQGLNIFCVKLLKGEATAGYINETECERVFNTGELKEKWIYFLSYEALTRIGMRMINNPEWSNVRVNCADFYKVEQFWIDRFGLNFTD